MYEYAKQYYAYSYIFFVLVIVFGNIMMFNLFLSIMMSNYDDENTAASAKSISKLG
jgi:hypothetical protein